MNILYLVLFCVKFKYSSLTIILTISVIVIILIVEIMTTFNKLMPVKQSTMIYIVSFGYQSIV